MDPASLTKLLGSTANHKGAPFRPSLIPPETLLVRDDAAAFLTDNGYPTASTTLATKATRGNGPPYRLYGRKPLYRVDDLLAWAENRCSKIVTSTSEYEAA